MELWEIGKGLIYLLIGVTYFKFFNKPYLDRETEEKWREMGESEQMINGSKFNSKLQFILGFIGGLGCLVGGFLYIYNELARYFGWVLLIVDK